MSLARILDFTYSLDEYVAKYTMLVFSQTSRINMSLLREQASVLQYSVIAMHFAKHTKYAKLM